MPSPDEVPAAPVPAVVSAASPELFAPRPVIGSLEFGFHAEPAAAYLRDVGETLSLYTDERVAHPGWLLRSANSVLVSNARMGPWIHVSSVVRHHGLDHDGVLDVLMVANHIRPVMRVAHTAIYEPRRSR